MCKVPCRCFILASSIFSWATHHPLHMFTKRTKSYLCVNRDRENKGFFQCSWCHILKIVLESEFSCFTQNWHQSNSKVTKMNIKQWSSRGKSGSKWCRVEWGCLRQVSCGVFWQALDHWTLPTPQCSGNPSLQVWSSTWVGHQSHVSIRLWYPMTFPVLENLLLSSNDYF